MKIRSNFVSNSSSTSYIVAVPVDFDFTKEWIEEIIVEVIRQEGIKVVDDENEIVDSVRKVLESIRKRPVSYQEGIMDQIGEFSGVFLIGDILDQLGLCLHSEGVDYESGQIVNVLSEKIKHRLKDILEQHKTCLE